MSAMNYDYGIGFVVVKVAAAEKHALYDDDGGGLTTGAQAKTGQQSSLPVSTTGSLQANKSPAGSQPTSLHPNADGMDQGGGLGQTHHENRVKDQEFNPKAIYGMQHPC